MARFGGFKIAAIATAFAMCMGVASSTFAQVRDYDPATRYAEGLQFLQSRNYPEAVKAFDDFLQVADEHADGQYYYGVSLLGVNDLKNARYAFERSVSANSKKIEARRELITTLLKLNNQKQAEKERDALQKMSDKCKDKCAEAAVLKGALASVAAGFEANTTPQAAR